MEVVADEETLDGKVDVLNTPLAGKSSTRHYNACSLSNPEKPHNVEHGAEHDVEVQLCGLRDPSVKDVPSLGPHQPGKVFGHGLLDHRVPEGGRGGEEDSLG